MSSPPTYPYRNPSPLTSSPQSNSTPDTGTLDWHRHIPSIPQSVACLSMSTYQLTLRDNKATPRPKSSRIQDHPNAIPTPLYHNTRHPQVFRPDDSTSGTWVGAIPGAMYGGVYVLSCIHLLHKLSNLQLSTGALIGPVLCRPTSRKRIPQDKTSSIRPPPPDVHGTSSEHLQWSRAQTQDFIIYQHRCATSWPAQSH